MGHSVPSAGHHSHFLPVCGTAADGSVHRPGILPKIAGDDAAVGPGQRVILKLLRQFHMGEVVFCGDDETGGVPVNAVDDAGPQFSVDPGKAVPAVIQQGVHQCPVRVSRRGVDHQPLRFVHHDDVLVLVHHVQRDILRHDVHRLRLRQFHRHRFPAGQPGVFSEGFSRRRHPALLHQLLNGGAGQLRLLCQPCVQPFSGILTGRLQDQRLHPFSSCHAFRRVTRNRSRPE